MMEVDFEKLNWPTGLNLKLLAPLAQFVPEDVFKRFIVSFARKARKDRRIILPSKRTIKKVYFHYVWGLIKSGTITWDEVKEKFKNDFKTLKAMDVTKFEVERLYDQREKEIKEEAK